MPQPSEDPALDHLHRDLGLGFILRLIGPGRQHRRTVVSGQFSIGVIDLRCITRGPGDRGLEVVRDQQLRRPAEEAQHALMRADPVRQRLGPGGFGIGVAGGAKHPDEDLGVADLAAMAIDHLDGGAAVVDKRLLAGTVLLAHAALLLRPPLAVELAETAVAIGPLLMPGHILGPKQLQGHPLALELLVDLKVVRLDEARRLLLGWEQQGLEADFVHPLGQGPGDTLGPGKADVLADRALGELAGAGDLLVAESGLVLEAQYFDDFLHWNPRCRHSPSPQAKDDGCAG